MKDKSHLLTNLCIRSINNRRKHEFEVNKLKFFGFGSSLGPAKLKYYAAAMIDLVGNVNNFVVRELVRFDTYF